MPVDHRPPAIFLMGPTASGKTALACELARRFPVALISVDSAQVYRGMDIGTAKPEAATLARFPHALIDIRNPVEPYSAAAFRDDALDAMREAARGARIPLLVGGTGLYFRALQHGLTTLPSANAHLRERLAGEARMVGWPSLHARLAELDPAAAARIGQHDAQRIQRALEVIELTGQPISRQHADAPPRDFAWNVLKLAWTPLDRQQLRERIAQRFDTMLEAGFMAEVERLLSVAPAPDLPAWRAVGYRQARARFEGEIGAAEFRRRAIAATRQLAKRQMTWLRSEHDAQRVNPEAAGAPDRIVAAVGHFLAHCAVPTTFDTAAS